MIDGYIIENNLNSDGAVFDTHLHDKYEINFILSENVEVIIEDKFFMSKRGDVFIFPPFTFHRIDSKKAPFSRFLMFFDVNSILKSAASLSPAISELRKHGPSVIHLEKPKADKMIKIFKKARNTLISAGKFEDFKNISQFAELLFYILDNAEHSDRDTIPTCDSKISKILTYVNNHIDENLSIENIADKFNISTTTLWHMTRSSLGMPLKEYISKIRIAKAMELLHEGMSVTEVSNRAGFNSYAHFIRSFKKAVGAPPYKYAKNSRDK